MKSRGGGWRATISFVLSEFGTCIQRYFLTHINQVWGTYGGRMHASSSLTERVSYGRIEAMTCKGIMGGIMDDYVFCCPTV